MSSGVETSLIISRNSKRFLDFARNDKWCSSEPYLHSRISRGSEIREPEHLRVMLAGQIIDTTEDRHVRVDFVFGGKVNEIVVFNVEIRSKEVSVQFFTGVDPLRFDGRAQLLVPKIRCRHVNFVTRSPRETRAFGRANIRRRSLLRI